MSDRADDEENVETAVDGGEDRIGALPDDLLRYLLSFLLSREAVRTCVLAKRWRTLWKSVPALRIDDPESYDGATGSSTFVNELLRLRDETPLNVCIINSDCKEMSGYDSDWDEEVFERTAPWLQYAVSCQVKELRVYFPLRVTNVTFISSHLKILRLYDILFLGPSLDLSSCQLLEVLQMDLCRIFADISSQSLKYLYINTSAFGREVRTNIFAPNLVHVQLAVCGGLTPLLNTMPSLVTAIITLEDPCYDYYCCRKVSCDGCSGGKFGDRSAVLKGLSGATNLGVTISGRAKVIFRNNFEWGNMFSKLKTLYLTEWCVVDDFVGLVYFLQHAPLLEELTLLLDFETQEKQHEGQARCSGEVLPTCAKRSWVRRSLSTLHFAGVRLASIILPHTSPSVGASSTGSVLLQKQHVTGKDESCNSSVPSIISKHLKEVKIICDTKEDARVHHILEILRTHGVPSEQIDIQ